MGAPRGSGRTAEQQSGRTAEQQSGRAAEQQRSGGEGRGGPELARFPQGLSVSSLVQRLHEQQYNVSHELARLLEAGLVEVRRQKKNQIYRLSAAVRVTPERDSIVLQVMCWNGQALKLCGQASRTI